MTAPRTLADTGAGHQLAMIVDSIRAMKLPIAGDCERMCAGLDKLKVPENQEALDEHIRLLKAAIRAACALHAAITAMETHMLTVIVTGNASGEPS